VRSHVSSGLNGVVLHHVSPMNIANALLECQLIVNLLQLRQTFEFL